MLFVVDAIFLYLGSFFVGNLLKEVSSRKPRDQDFPGGPVVKTLCSKAGGLGSIPGSGCSQKKKKKMKISCANAGLQCALSWIHKEDPTEPSTELMFQVVFQKQ